MPAGPVGTTRSPLLQGALNYVSLGLYSPFFWWRAHRELSRYLGWSVLEWRTKFFGGIALASVAVIVVTIAVFGIADGPAAWRRPVGIVLLSSLAAFFIGGLLAIAAVENIFRVLDAEESRLGLRTIVAARAIERGLAAAAISKRGGRILDALLTGHTQSRLNTIWAAAAEARKSSVGNA